MENTIHFHPLPFTGVVHKGLSDDHQVEDVGRISKLILLSTERERIGSGGPYVFSNAPDHIKLYGYTVELVDIKLMAHGS